MSNSPRIYWAALGGFVIVALSTIASIAWQGVHLQAELKEKRAEVGENKIKAARLDDYCEKLLTLVNSIQARLRDPALREQASSDLAMGPLGMGSRSTLELCAPSVDLSRFERCYVALDVGCLNEITSAITRDHHQPKAPW